jgi:asparagine synthase (glutamine-hydrolysing)
MCGIAGLIGRLSPSNRDALRRMNDSMAHRGPDGDATWESTPDDNGRGVMLAHRRLSILDLTNCAAQPMVDPVTGDVIVFNGEIYNYVTLRDRLAAEGQQMQSTGDTAVMLRMLGLHGRQAVRDLRGMFTIAFWDVDERRLVLARDALGIKPLYVARNQVADGDWSLIFASEVRAILASGLIGKPRLNPQAIASVVWNGFVVTPETAVAGIEPVWPGQLCVFDTAGREQNETFWTPPQPPAHHRQSPDLAAELEHSVRLHLASDVPLAVFLSGGVDSAAVANLAHRTSQTPVQTFTLAFEEQEYNEGDIARRIANAIGTTHQEVVLTEQRFVTHLDAALDSLDQPTFDGLNSYYMSQAVREAGFKVALVGTGGDELFGGYGTFRDLPRMLQLRALARFIPPALLETAAKYLSGAAMRSAVPPQTRWAKLPAMVRRGDDLLSLYQLSYALFLPDFQRQLIAGGMVDVLRDGLPDAMRASLLEETCGRSSLAAISLFEQRLFLGERLLRDTDATSMAASIEVRLPLVDQILFEDVNRMTDSERYHPLLKKSALRRAGLRGLDPALFERPKSGFVLPYDRWLRTGLGDVMDHTMRDADALKPVGLNPDAVSRLWQAFRDGAPGLYWSRVWAIYVLVRWCHRHQVYV